MSATVLLCGNVFDGVSEALTGPSWRSWSKTIASPKSADRSAGRSDAHVIDLSERTVSPGFIDTHVHLTMDAADLPLQTLQSSAAKALKGLSIAREYMNYGFTTLPRSRQRRSGMADDRSAQRAQCRACTRTTALRRRAYHQRECRSWRSSRLLRLPLDVAGLGDCR